MFKSTEILLNILHKRAELAELNESNILLQIGRRALRRQMRRSYIQNFPTPDATTLAYYTNQTDGRNRKHADSDEELANLKRERRNRMLRHYWKMVKAGKIKQKRAEYILNNII